MSLKKKKKKSKKKLIPEDSVFGNQFSVDTFDV